MTTGPGLSVPTATATKNSRPLSQPVCYTRPFFRKGTMTRPLPKVGLPALKKKVNSWPSVEAVVGLAGIAPARGRFSNLTQRAMDTGWWTLSQPHQEPGFRHERGDPASKESVKNLPRVGNKTPWDQSYNVGGLEVSEALSGGTPTAKKNVYLICKGGPSRSLQNGLQSSELGFVDRFK